MIPNLDTSLFAVRAFKNIIPSEGISANWKTVTAKRIPIPGFVIVIFG